MTKPPLDPLLINADKLPHAGRRRKPTARETLNRYGAQLIYGPWRTPNRRWVSASVIATTLIGALLAWHFATRPVPKPDYATAGLDKVFGYTLLTSEFNRLPIEERLELLGVVVQRLKNMDQSDSMLLAGFAAGIQGKARDQLMENASRLMIDAADMIAGEYHSVPPEKRAEFLDDAFIRLTQIAETISGESSSRSPEEQLAQAKRQAERDSERLRARPVSMRQSTRMFQFMDGDMGQHAAPQQRGRIAVLMRDMTRHLRGQDVQTGRPRPPGGG